MIEFKNEDFAWFFLLIPLIVASFMLYTHLRRKRLARYGDINLMKPLMPLVSRYRGWFKIILTCLAIFFFVLALMQPRIGEVVDEVQSKGIEAVIALDVSNSMLATDFSPSRLERSKMAISRLVEGMKGDRIGLIVFAGDAYMQLPITNDYMSAKIFLNAINTSIVSRQGTNIEKAIVLAMKSYSSQSEKSRALIIITDGENQEGNPVEIAEIAHKDGITIHTIGIGSAQGSPIRFANGDMMKDKNGQIVVSRLDETTLQQIAAAGGGSCTIANPSDLGLNAVLKNIKEMEKRDLLSSRFKAYYELFYIPLAFALILLALEALILERKNKILHNLDVFKLRS
jgi:Ca-activated chloride channel family protein